MDRLSLMALDFGSTKRSQKVFPSFFPKVGALNSGIFIENEGPSPIGEVSGQRLGNLVSFPQPADVITRHKPNNIIVWRNIFIVSSFVK